MKALQSAKAAFNRMLGRHPKLEVKVRLAQRRYYASHGHFPDLTPMLGGDRDEWRRTVEASRDKPVVLIPTSIGSMHGAIYLETVLAMGLALRGMRPVVMLCDGVLPACQECSYKWFPDMAKFAAVGPAGGPQRRLCDTCHAPASRMLASLGIEVVRYSDFLTPEDHQLAEQIASGAAPADVAQLKLDGLAIGEHALAGALRFFARATLDGEPAGQAVLRRYLRASVLAARAMQGAIDKLQPKSSVFNHGIYVPQGLLGEVARQRGLPLSNWNPAYRSGCFVFSHGDTYHHTLLDEPTSTWENIDFTPPLRDRTMNYLHSRRYGRNDWIWFHEKPNFDLAPVSRELGIDFDKPYVGLLTNVAWDAQLHYRENAFANMMDWLIKSVRYFAGRADLQLLIRIHPAERTAGLPSRQRALDELRKAMPELPDNVFILGPEHTASTYAVMSKANAAIIYGTKTGVELAAVGTPVIVAGEAWSRNKGITIDAHSEREYYEILDRLPFQAGMSDEQIERARQYAFHFFFRRMIPVKAMTPAPDWRPYVMGFNGLDVLRPGGCGGLDVICRGVIDGEPYVYPAECEEK